MADPSSYASRTAAVTKHIHWDITSLSFADKIISASATLVINSTSPLTSLTLDTRHLKILSVHQSALPVACAWPATGVDGTTFDEAVKQVSSPPSSSAACDFALAPHDAAFGSALTITLANPAPEGSFFLLRVVYETSPSCSAAQWLTPAQTASKTHPYFFTQCQAIHARSLIPCQDTPGVKATYSANVAVPPGLTAVMSGLSRPAPADSAFAFAQPVPIPSYLLALAVGRLSSTRVGPRTRVWSEEATLAAGAYEFSGTEAFLTTAESLVSPYAWGVFDLLLLPPSFPYGGMENPCLTFVTPTLLAGDRSLVDVVAHEIAHSWSGNLVTAATWGDFWLNEGWTVFLERKIIGRLHGEQARQFSAIIGWGKLKDSVELFGEENPLTKLVVDLEGCDPDDAFSSVPYERGFNLLYHLELAVGGPEIFEPYMKAYFKRFENQAITTADWKAFLYEYFADQKVVLDAVEWQKWLHTPGMPPVDMPFDTNLVERCSAFSNRWKSVATEEDAAKLPPSEYEALSTGQKVLALEQFEDPLEEWKLVAMDKQCALTESKNCEIKFRWFQLCLKSPGKTTVIPAVATFLAEQGRMKYVRPLFRSLAAFEEGKVAAVATFKTLKSSYHPICAQMVAKDLGVA